MSGSVPCYNLYNTKQGYLSVGCLEPHFWIGFVAGVGLPKLKPLQFAFARGKECEKVKQEIEQVLEQKTALEWEEFFTNRKDKLPVLALRHVEDLKNDPLLEIRGMSAKLGPSLVVAKPGLDYTNFLQNRSPATPAPKLGEHNQQVLSKL